MEASDLSDVFVSYRRTDVEFAKKLVDALQQRGKEVWIDWEDIPPGSEAFTDDIKRGLEGADSFLCVLSPEYFQSSFCVDMELGYAVELNKKIIPVVYKEFDASGVPSAVGHINWIYFIPHAGHENTFGESFPKVMDALEQDYEHAREHRRLALRAIDWQSNDHRDSFLLTGDEIQRAEEWLEESSGKIPEPTNLHRNYILGSRTAANRRQQQQRIAIGAFVIISSLTILAIGLGIFANFQRQRAVVQADLAATNAAIAQENESTAVSALDEAKFQADRASTQASIAEDNAITATIAQGEAEIQADNASTQAAIAQENEGIAQQNASTATVAQGIALMEANNASTQAAIAVIARGQAEDAATRESIAQQTAAFLQESASNSTQAALDAIKGTEVSQALETSEANAATATVAQGQAEIQAQIAQENAATATIAQGIALVEAERAATQAAIAEENAATAVVAQGIARQEADAAATAEQVAENRRREAQAQALIVRADQARLFGDSDVALALALQAADLNPNLLQTQSVLNQAAAVSPRLRIPSVQKALLRPTTNHVLALSSVQPDQLTLWNVETQAVVYSISAGAPVEDFAISQDGQFIVAALGDAGVAIWSAQTGSVVQLLQDQSSNRVLIHPDDMRFISAGTNGVIFVRDIQTGEVLAELTNSTTSPYNQITFNSDGRWLYAWSLEAPIVVTLWDFVEFRNVKRSIEPYIMISEDRAFRVGREDGQLTIRNMDGDGLVQKFDGDIVHIHAFSPDNSQILVQGQGGRFGNENRLVLMNRLSRDVAVMYTDTIGFNLNAVRDAQFLPNSTEIVSVQTNDEVVVWNSLDGELVRRIGVSSNPLELIDRNQNIVVTLSENNTVLIYDLVGLVGSAIQDPEEKAREAENIKATYFEDGGLYGELYDLDWQLASFPDQYVLSTFDGFNLALTDTLRDEQVALIPNRFNDVDSSIRLFSPNLRYVVLGWREGYLRVWDTQTSSVLWEKQSPENTTNLEEIIFLRGDTQFVAFYGESAILWDITTGEVVHDYRVPGFVSPLTRNTILNNGDIHSWMFVERHNRVLIDQAVIARILFDEATLSLYLVEWDIQSNELVVQLDLRTGIVGTTLIGARFSLSGETYVRIGQDSNVIEMYNTYTRVLIRRFIGHKSRPVGVAFNPTGQQLVSAAEDGEIILWDVQTGQLVRTLVMGSTLNTIQPSYNVVFSPDGAFVGFTPDDTPIPSANLEIVKVETLSDVVAWVHQNRNIRALSCAEREQYSVLPLCDGSVETPTPTSTLAPIQVRPTQPPTPTLSPTPTALPKGVIRASSNVNLRSGPSADFRILMPIPPDTIVIILDDTSAEGWVHIELLDGNRGWVLEGVIAR